MAKTEKKRCAYCGVQIMVHMPGGDWLDNTGSAQCWPHEVPNPMGRHTPNLPRPDLPLKDQA